MQDRKRRLMLLLIAVVCFAMLFSCFGDAATADHACSHAGCELCVLQNVCRELQGVLTLAAGVLAILLVRLTAVIHAGTKAVRRFSCPTLITNKIRLSI